MARSYLRAAALSVAVLLATAALLLVGGTPATAQEDDDAQLISPTPGSVLPGAAVTFAWLGTSDVVEYWLEVGSAAGGNDLYGASQGLAMTVTVTGLPRDGRALSVRLWARVGDQWSFGDVPYTAASLIDDHGSDVETATAIAVGMAAASVVTVGGNIERGEDADWFSFVAVAGARYTFSTDLGTLTDTVLDLLDGRGALISSNDDVGVSNASRIDWSAPGGGTYFLAVRAWSPTQIGTYTLAVTTVAEPSEGHAIKAVLASLGRINDILQEVINTYADPAAAIGDGTYLRGRVEAVRQEKLQARRALPSLFPDVSGDTTPAQLPSSFDSWYFRFSALEQQLDAAEARARSMDSLNGSSSDVFVDRAADRSDIGSSLTRARFWVVSLEASLPNFMKGVQVSANDQTKAESARASLGAIKIVLAGTIDDLAADRISLDELLTRIRAAGVVRYDVIRQFPDVAGAPFSWWYVGLKDIDTGLDVLDGLTPGGAQSREEVVDWLRRVQAVRDRMEALLK